MGSQLRAQKDGFRIKSLSQDFQDPHRSTELKNWTILTKQVLSFPPKIIVLPSVTVKFCRDFQFLPSWLWASQVAAAADTSTGPGESYRP